MDDKELLNENKDSENTTDHTENTTNETASESKTEASAIHSAFSMPEENKTDAGTNTGDNAFSQEYTVESNTYSTNYYDSSNTYGAASTPEVVPTGFGIASLILGIISIPMCCCCGLGLITGILGLVFGCLQKKNAFGSKPGIAIAGIIISIIAIIINLGVLGLSIFTGSFADQF